MDKVTTPSRQASSGVNVLRRFSAAYKLAILAQIEAAAENGQVGQILRREGLYSSLISEWPFYRLRVGSRQRERGAFEALNAKKRGPQRNGLAKEALKAECLGEALGAPLFRRHLRGIIQAVMTRRLGFEPLERKTAVIKMDHLMPDLKRSASRILLALSPGAVDQAIERLPFERLRRLIYQLDPAMTWQPDW